MKEKLPLLILLACIAWMQHAVGQPTWNYNSGAVTVSGTLSLYSTNGNDDPTVGVEHYPSLSMEQVLRLNSPWTSGGIMASMQAGGKVTLKMYLYDQHKDDGFGPLLYECYSDVTNTGTFVENGVSITDQPDPQHPLSQAFYNLLFTKTRSSIDSRKPTLAGSQAYLGISGTPNAVQSTGRNRLPVIISMEVINATVTMLKLPGIGVFAPYDAFYRQAHPITSMRNVFTNPSQFPNYLMVAAHRGYFRDVADNSLAALRLAIGLNVPMMEIDIQHTKDSVWVLSHDAEIGQTPRTRIPDRLKSKLQPGKTSIPISELTLCELRPDLCNNACAWNSTDYNCQPVLLGQQDGDDVQPMPTLQEALFLCRNRTLLDMDKIDKGPTRNQAPFHLVWNEVKAGGMQGYAIVKGKNWSNPQQMQNAFPDVNWTEFMYTPTYFAENTVTTGDIDN
jgi:glycerophosphoryl diester phosphodiesterase